MVVVIRHCEMRGETEMCSLVKGPANGPLGDEISMPKAQAAAIGLICQPPNGGALPTAARGSAANAKVFNPPYLSGMPPIDLVKHEIQGKDATDTLARQVAVFNMLPTVITRFMLADGKRYGLTLDEAKISGEYGRAAYDLEQDYKKTHTAAEGQAFAQLHGRYELDSALDREMHTKLFSPASLQQLGYADKTRNQAYQAHLDQEKRAGEEATVQANASQNGFVRNDPGTLAARRCVELGGSDLECVGKGFSTGLMDMVGLNTEAIKGPEFTGLAMNGRYLGAADLNLQFGSMSLSLTLNGCGKLVPNGLAYALTKKTNQVLINVKSEPAPFVLSMANDGKLTGPGPIDIKGQIIAGYRKVWMQRYHNGVPVSGDGYWDSVPIYAPKTERCTIGTLTQAPPPPPPSASDKSLIGQMGSELSKMFPEGPPGLRVNGHYAGAGGLALEFAPDSVILDCGAAHVKQAYTVENTPAQIRINMQNGSSPFTLAVQPDGTLIGSGSTEVAGRLVTGSTDNALTYAPKNARCAIGALQPKGGSSAAHLQ